MRLCVSWYFSALHRAPGSCCFGIVHAASWAPRPLKQRKRHKSVNLPACGIGALLDGAPSIVLRSSTQNALHDHLHENKIPLPLGATSIHNFGHQRLGVTATPGSHGQCVVLVGGHRTARGPSWSIGTSSKLSPGLATELSNSRSVFNSSAA